MTLPKSTPLQQRLKDQMRAAVADITISLFIENGFEATTVDEICSAAGISRRTFFRYFRCKEDVVVTLLSQLAEDGCHHFVDSPADEDGWTSLRSSMIPFEQWTHDAPGRTLALYNLIETTPYLRASYLERVDRWRASLADVICAKFDVDAELSVSVIAAASVGAYLAATRAWAQSGGTESLPALFDQAFDTLRRDATLPWEASG